MGLIAGAWEAVCFSFIFLFYFFASLLQNRPGWWCIMHGASYVQLERAVSPVGSAWERGVQIHILLHGAGHLKNQNKKKENGA